MHSLSSKRWRQPMLQGSRLGILSCCIVAIGILSVNIAVFIWSMANRTTRDSTTGLSTLAGGDCGAIKSKNTYIQVIIALLSTLLLGASNYCMQCVGAPTRDEVDKSHAKRVALCIGVPSLSNLYSIDWKRRIIWIPLGLSALPIHFLYNSVTIMTVQATSYTVLAGPEGFMEPGFKDEEYYDMQNCSSSAISLARRFREQIRSGNLDLLPLEQCHHEYTQQYVARRGDLLLIQDGTKLFTDARCNLMSQNGSTEWGPWDGGPWDDSPFQSTYRRKKFPYRSDPHSIFSYDWVRPFPTIPFPPKSNIESSITALNKWEPFGTRVRWCFSQSMEEKCTLEMDYRISLAVLFCIMVKAGCMCFALVWSQRPGLITLGDAAESFISVTDRHTTGLCMLSAKQIDLLWSLQRIAGAWPEFFGPSRNQKVTNQLLHKTWAPTKPRWWRSATPSRFYSFLLLLMSIFVAWVCLAQIKATDGNFPISVSTQPGKNQIALRTTLSGAILLANAPQLLCSYIFLGFNYLLTCMVASHEWMSYSQRRNTLRVTNPTGQQRNTYWLQLPFYFSLPLLAISGLLSWLTSQVLFVVRVHVRESLFSTGRSNEDWMVTCGYSPGAIVLTVIIGVVLAVTMYLIGLQEYPDTIPLAGSSSAAIAAACHVLQEDDDCATQPLQWGVVSQKGGLGHCAFSARLVAPPIPGRLYR